MKDREHQIAVAFLNWWAYQAKTRSLDHRLLFAIPNGGHRAISVARKLKAEGVRAGIPDYFLAVPTGGFSGLFIELKSETGYASDAQQEMLNLFLAQGFKVALVKGIIEAMEVVVSYLGDPGTPGQPMSKSPRRSPNLRRYPNIHQ